MQKRKIIIVVLVFAVILILVGIFVFTKNKDKKEVNKKEPIQMCYIYSKDTDRGFKDVFKLKLNIDGPNVTGEFDSLPAEKDTKTGDFSGTVGPLDQQSMSRKGEVWWNSFAEGMHVTEELRFSFGDGSAQIIGGEMEDRGDGVYIYKKDSKPIYGYPTMSQIDCQYLNEIEVVEKYIRDNIKEIAKDKPVLGGSWYVLSVNVVPGMDSGDVRYEDGHIQSTASFTYKFDINTKKVSIDSFKVR